MHWIFGKLISWFESYLSGRTFKVNIDQKFLDQGNLTCGVPQGSILGPLLFLLYVNVYADDTCLTFQVRNVKEIEDQLNLNFSSLCDWFISNKLSIHLGEGKIKFILSFGTKLNIKPAEPLNIVYGNVKIKQYTKVTYLGCILDESLSGKLMALHVLYKINSRLRSLYRQNRSLNKPLWRLLCNAMIQSFFDACFACYPSLGKDLQKWLQVSQNNCVRLYLQLDKKTWVGVAEFKEIKWLNVNDRFSQSVLSSIYKFLRSESPEYFNQIHFPAEPSNITTRSSFQRLKQPLRKSNIEDLNSASYSGPSLWNKLPIEIKRSGCINSFKHNVKNYYLTKIEYTVLLRSS